MNQPQANFAQDNFYRAGAVAKAAAARENLERQEKARKLRESVAMMLERFQKAQASGQ